MSSEIPITPASDHVILGSTLQPRRHLCWGSILAGTAAALSLEVLFVMLGSAVGFALFSPLKDTNPAENFGAGAVAIEGLSAVVSLWFGGWVAGRLSPAGIRSTGMLHGFLVWCLVNIIGVLVVTSGAASAVSGVSRVVGASVAGASKSLTDKASDAAKDALDRSKSTLTSFADEAGSTTGTSNRSAAIRTRRDLGLALGRLFDSSQNDKLADNRAAVVKILVDDAGMSQADAEKTVNDWTTSYNQLQADIAAAKERAEEQARLAAERARKELAIVSFATFLAFLIGAAAASCGACHGVREARHHDGLLDPVR